MRKYEVHLPLTYSDGTPIEQEKVNRAREEIIAIFGSFLVPDRRAWKYDGVKYIEIGKIEILTTEDKVAKKVLKDFNKRLKKSLRQDDILITTHRIQSAYSSSEILDEPERPIKGQKHRPSARPGASASAQRAGTEQSTTVASC